MIFSVDEGAGNRAAGVVPGPEDRCAQGDRDNLPPHTQGHHRPRQGGVRLPGSPLF
jgi:hypothetical protein